MPTWKEEVLPLLGKRVHAKLDDHVIVTGTLLAASEMGEFVIEEGGDFWHCWPLLAVEEAKP